MNIISISQSTKNNNSNPSANLCNCCQKPLSEKQIKNKNKYCSQSCSAKVTNTQRKTRLTKHCKCCGKLIPKARTYCSECYFSKIEKASPVNKKYHTKEALSKANIGYVNKVRSKNKETLVKMLGGECMLCGYHRNIKALEFHHLNPNEKEFTISEKSNWSKERLLNEAKKCVLLCANCHREVHDELLTNSEYNKFLAEEKVRKLSK